MAEGDDGPDWTISGDEAPEHLGSDQAAVATLTEEVTAELVAFVRGLRTAGADVPVNASLPAAESLAAVGFGDRERARYALRAALLTRPADRDLFDRLFEQFWSRLDDLADANVDEESDEGGLEPPTIESPSGEGDETGVEDESLGDATRRRGLSEGADADGDDAVTSATYSPVGQSEAVESVAPSGDDDDRTAEVTERLTRALAAASGRREERADTGRRIDARSTLRESLATGGTALSLPERERKQSDVRGVLLADVSRSVLDVIDRDFLLRFARLLRREWQSARIFLFDTDVREVSDAFDADSTAEAYAELERAETAWGGGTRIGHALTTMRHRYPAAIDRRTVVLVLSDGLEMGDVDELEAGMAWLADRAPLVLWLNPLATDPGFEPTATGMAAAAPHVDGIFPFAGPADVEEMARQLERYAGNEPIGYRQDARRIA